MNQVKISPISKNNRRFHVKSAGRSPPGLTLLPQKHHAASSVSIPRISFQKETNNAAIKGDLRNVISIWKRQTLLPDVLSLDICAGKGHLNVITWVFNQTPKPFIRSRLFSSLIENQSKLHPSTTGLGLAVEHGQLHVLKWVVKNLGIEFLPRDTYSIDMAISNNFRKTVNYMKKQQLETQKSQFCFM
ncbi:MAG: hypothetical protein JKX76_01060 [Colwellia sp.]|nr:hypothetical protein [Colwellia sp.]